MIEHELHDLQGHVSITMVDWKILWGNTKIPDYFKSTVGTKIILKCYKISNNDQIYLALLLWSLD